MKIVLTNRRAFEGLTYQPGEYEVDEETAAKLFEKFPNVCAEWTAPKPKTRKRSKAGESESATDSAGLPEA